MWAIFRYFWNICLLKAGPENIPSNTLMTSALLLIYSTVSFISISISKTDATAFAMAAAIIFGITIEISILYALLVFKNFTHRFLSTLSAMLGANIIILLVLFPVNILLLKLEDGILVDFVTTISLVCFFWWLGIVGFILHRASNISLMQGAMLAFIIELLSVIATRAFLPEIA